MAKRFTYGVNLAPLIDVVFILLAFMLIYSRMDVTESIDVALPQAEGQAAEVEKPVVISIRKDGAFFWGDGQISEAELPGRIEALGREQAVVIQADREADAESLIRLMSVLSRAGIQSANIKVAGTAR